MAKNISYKHYGLSDKYIYIMQLLLHGEVFLNFSFRSSLNFSLNFM
jgi:hypothetical protein